MDTILRSVMDTFSPKVSKQINGTMDRELSKLPEFIDGIFRNAMKLLHPSIPVEYLGYERMSPIEEVKYMQSNRYVHDMAVSNVYMVNFRFRIHGSEILEKPIYLLYAEQGNILRISGTRYVLSYIISDRSLSPSINGIFLKLMISKLNFTITHKLIMKNNEKINVDIKHSTILLLKIIDKLGKPITPCYMYLLARYGVSHFDSHMKIYIDDDDKTKSKELEGEYDIYNSVYPTLGTKPKGYLLNAYVPHNLHIAVKKGTPANMDLISAIIYSLDMLPYLAEDVVKAYGNPKKEIEVFILLLSRLLYKESFSAIRMREDTIQHLNSLEGYLDIPTKENLKYIGIEVDNFYELLYEIVTKYQDLVTNFKDYHNNIRNKYMDVKSYLTYDIIYTINKILLRVNRRGNQITLKETVKNFTELSPKKIFTVVKSNGQNLTLSVLDNSSDLIYIKSTAIQEDQSRGDGVKRGRKNQFPANIKTFAGQHAFLGTPLYLLRSAPSALLRRNAYLETLEDGNIVIPGDLEKSIIAMNGLLTLSPSENPDEGLSELLNNMTTIE